VELTGLTLGVLSRGARSNLVSVVGRVRNNTGGQNALVRPGLDGTGFGQHAGGHSATADYTVGASAAVALTPAEGYHTASAIGQVSGGTGTFAISLYVETEG
jgi:hypothetical protein